jgi:hypothetical protein
MDWLGKHILAAQLSNKQSILTEVLRKLGILMKEWKVKDEGYKRLMAAFALHGMKPNREIQKFWIKK